MRLIDLDSEYIQETLYRRGFKTRQDIEEWLNSAPIIDAVPVVRCKDCKFGAFSSTAISISIVATNFPLIMLVLLSVTAVPCFDCF